MWNKVQNYISQHSLLDKKDLHLVALSGGADSVCLLRVMVELGYKVHAVHCNFHLRGEESNCDEEFCINLCNELGIELHRTHFATRDYAELHKVSIEMAARELRYGYFEQLRVALEAATILVAHHSDDNVETVLINLIRGTGIRGLEGIKPKNGNIIRPLLCVSRQEILDYLTLKGQAYVTDSTNLVNDVVRNKIRLDVLPLLESINPAVRKNILRTASNVGEATPLLNQSIEKAIDTCVRIISEKNPSNNKLPEENHDATLSIDLPTLLLQPSPEMVLYEILKDYGFSGVQAVDIFGCVRFAGSTSGTKHAACSISGTIWQSGEYTLAGDRSTLLLQRTRERRKPFVIPESGNYILPSEGKSIQKSGSDKRIIVKIQPREKDFIPSKDPTRVTLDADRVRFPLTLRPTEEGDRFKPFGMKGSKLVSDYLTDRKRNYFHRLQQLVLTDAQGEIVWLVGERTAQSAAITPETTSILEISLS